MKKFICFSCSIILCGIIYLLSCGKDPASSGDQDITGTISGTVTDSAGVVLSGVSVTTDTGGYTSVADTIGHYTIPYVKAGTYSLTFTKENYADTTVGSITIAKAEEVVNVNMSMRYNPSFGSLFGIVCDSASRVPWVGVPILISPVGKTGISNSNGEYLITQIPIGTYTAKAYSTFRSNTINNISVIKDDTTIIVDTLWSVPNNMVEHDINGKLTGNLTDIAKITATVTGDSIDPDNPIITNLTWLPVSQRYTGFVYVPNEGILWDVEIKVYDSDDHITGYRKMAFDAGVGDIAMPDFDAWNAKPVPIASCVQSVVSINDTLDLKGTALDTVYGTGIVKWEWDAGNSGTFVETTPDSIYRCIAPSVENSYYQCVLRITDDDGNVASDIVIINVLQDIPIANAGNDTGINIGSQVALYGTATQQYGIIVKWEWKIGGNDYKVTSSGDTIVTPPSIICDQYPCVLRVTDDDDNIDEDTIYIQVGIWEPVGIKGFSDVLLDISLAINDNNVPYVAFRDNANNDKATVMKYNGSQWEPVGNEGFTDYGIDEISLAIDGNNVPFVAFRHNSDGRAKVMKYNGTEWDTIGNIEDGADSIILAINDDNTLYIGYLQYDYGLRTTVMKYNGTVWEPVGNKKFSDGGADFLSLAIDNTNIPLVAFRDGANGGRATAMKYSGTAWEPVGIKGFSDNAVEYVSLAIDNTNMPLVAFRDEVNDGKATVMKYNGTTWESVGNEGLSDGNADYISLSIDESNVSFIAFRDGANDNKATVMKYNSTEWEPVGNVGFSDGEASIISFAISENGTPYIAFQDFSADNKITVYNYK